MTCREAEPLLHARLDQELDAAGSASIDHHLSDCRACAAHYAALQSLHEEIAAAELSYAPAPAFEQKLANQFLPEKQSPALSFWRKSWRPAYALAGVAALTMLLLLFPSMWTAREADAVGIEILDSHLRSLQPSHLVDVPSSDQHTVKPWYQGKTSFSPPVPDLSEDGFILVGGRLEVIHQQPAAAIVYQRRQHVVSLYVSPSPGADAKSDLRELGGYHLLHWTQDNMSYWAVSDVNTKDLREFEDLLRRK